MDKKYEDDEFVNELIKVNHFITTEDKIKIVFSKPNKMTKKWMVSFEVSGSTFIKMVNRYINIGWNSHYVKEDNHILRCFNCQGYHHSSRNCSNDIVCPKCSGNHKINDCNSNLINCHNCCINNAKFKSNFSTEHKADSTTCKVYLSKVYRLQQNTSYSI